MTEPRNDIYARRVAAARIRREIEEILADAVRDGVWVTITTEPLPGLAMGNKRMVVDTYPARRPGDPLVLTHEENA